MTKPDPPRSINLRSHTVPTKPQHRPRRHVRYQPYQTLDIKASPPPAPSFRRRWPLGDASAGQLHPFGLRAPRYRFPTYPAQARNLIREPLRM